MFSQTFDRRGDPRVADGEESAGRGPRGEPVPRRESLDQRHKVRLQVRCAVLFSHVTQALDRLRIPFQTFDILEGTAQKICFKIQVKAGA